MITIDIGNMEVRKAHDMLDWLVDNYGTIDQGRWELEDLTYVKFVRDSDATMFLLRWVNG